MDTLKPIGEEAEALGEAIECTYEQLLSSARTYGELWGSLSLSIRAEREERDVAFVILEGPKQLGSVYRVSGAPPNEQIRSDIENQMGAERFELADWRQRFPWYTPDNVMTTA